MIAGVAPAGQQGARIDQRQAVGGTVTEPFKRQSRTLAHPPVVSLGLGNATQPAATPADPA